ncbi:MAG TPA: methyltransferase domain-containing protein [Candidatus Dormibacteraeota bacterium]|nr:methyltransferase domain-containing protein [Candidatus Dormibacteraeota bacterium]
MSEVAGLNFLGKFHGRFVHQRRIVILAERLATHLSPGCRLLDVGCGDGQLGALLRKKVPGLAIQGVEVQPRGDCAIPCKPFDGVHLPFPDGYFDGCLFVDVLHHTLEPSAILGDAYRVSRNFILIKDHLAETSFDHWTLRLMDWVGNRPHGVVLPYAYLSSPQWDKLIHSVGLEAVQTDRNLPLYPAPFSLLFGRKLHFISEFRKRN